MSNAEVKTGILPVGESLREFLAWALVASFPLALYFVLCDAVFAGFGFGLNHQQAMFIALGSAAVLMWAFRLAPDFVPGLALILIVVLMNLVPQSVAFSGFYSEIFFLIFGIFILAALLPEQTNP